VYADGAGGPLTEAVVRHMRPGGRLFSYGSSAAFFEQTPGVYGDRSLRETRGVTPAVERLIAERGIVHDLGFVHDRYDRRLQAEDHLNRLLAAGSLKPVTTIVHGFDNLPAAVAGLYRDGGRFGKLQVRFG